MVFQQKSGDSVQSCQLNLQAQLVHGLIHLLKETVVKAAWEMATPNRPLSSEAQGDVPISPTTYKH